MKAKLLCLSVLVAMAACSQEGNDFAGMTAGEEVLWMHDWMERAYGQRPEEAYEYELYQEQAPAVKDYVDGVIWGCEAPAEPLDLMQYFAGIPDEMLCYYWADDDEEAIKEIKTFWDGVQLLQDYASDKSDYFPLEEVQFEIYKLLDRYMNISSHVGMESAYEYSYELLAFRLAQQLIRTSPDVDNMADFTVDKIGVWTIGKKNYVFSSILLLPEGENIYMPVMVREWVAEIIYENIDGKNVYHFFDFDEHLLFSLFYEDEMWRKWSPDIIPGQSGLEPEQALETLSHMLGHIPESESYWKWGDDLIVKTVNELKRYASHERKYYPAEDVRTVIGIMLSSWEYALNHAVAGTDDYLPYISLFTEAAAFYASDINYISSQASSDHVVGIVNYDTLYLDGQILLALYLENGVYRVKTLALALEDDYMELLSPRFDGRGIIRKIGNPEDRMYILSLEEADPAWFSQCLCWYDDDGHAHFFVPKDYGVIDSEWFTDDLNDVEEAEIIFNPGKICWNICTKVGSTYQPIKGSRTLYLELDGLNSSYHVE